MKKISEKVFQLVPIYDFRLFIKWLGVIIVPLLLLGCGLLNDSQTFHDKETGFSIKLPKNWETMQSVTNIDGLSLAPQENTIVYMDPNTWADKFTFAKIVLPPESANMPEEEILKEAGLDMGRKVKIDGQSVYAFSLADVGGFFWIRNSTLYFALIQVNNESFLEPIFKSARFKS